MTLKEELDALKDGIETYADADGTPDNTAIRELIDHCVLLALDAAREVVENFPNLKSLPDLTGIESIKGGFKYGYIYGIEAADDAINSLAQSLKPSIDKV